MSEGLGGAHNGSAGRTRRFLIGLILTLAASALAAPAAGAVTIAVTEMDDELNADGDCSLREAVRAANLDTVVDGCAAGNFADSIVVPAGTYTFSTALDGDDDNAMTGDLDLGGNDGAGVTLVGQGVGTTEIDANGLDRVFHLPDPSVSHTMRDLTIRGGLTPVGGGGVFVREGARLVLERVAVRDNVSGHTGGGLRTFGSFEGEGPGRLDLKDVTIADNKALATGGGSGIGGGISNAGQMRIERATVSGNTATERGAGISTSGPAELTNVTISANGRPVSAENADSDGGGIWAFRDMPEDVAILSHVTLSGNAAGTTGSGGNLYSMSDGAVRLTNTIVANPLTGGNCGGGSAIADGGNLEFHGGNDSCFSSPPNRDDADPLLGPLADNGGPTLTHALPASSPAIDSALGQLCGAGDQRGAPRPAGGGCDIGAFELQEPSPPPPPPPPPSDDGADGDGDGNGGPDDVTPPALRAKAKGKQKVKRLAIKVACANEPCEVRIGGKAVAKRGKGGSPDAAASAKRKKSFKLKPKRRSLAAGERQKLRLRFRKNKKTVRKLRRLIKGGWKARAKVRVIATDRAGNVDRRRLAVKLRR